MCHGNLELLGSLRIDDVIKGGSDALDDVDIFGYNKVDVVLVTKGSISMACCRHILKGKDNLQAISHMPSPSTS